MNKWIYIILLICTHSLLRGQTLVVSGKVIDGDTQKPVPFVNVVSADKKSGTMTDTLGLFTLKCGCDSILFSTIGYQIQTRSVNDIKKNSLVKIWPEVTQLNEVDVKPSDERVQWILRQTRKRKAENNPEKYNRYNYQKYSKWDYTINHAEKTLMHSKYFKNYTHLFKQAADSSYYLPVYFSEQVVYNEFQRKPLIEKSTIKADKTSGVGVLDQLEIGGYTSGLDLSINFYDNYIKLYEQNFVSPLADNGNFYYRYYLTDSTEVNQCKYFEISFYPKRKGENVFVGKLWVDNQLYAIQKIDAKITSRNQLNFINNLQLYSEFQMLDDSIPFYKSNQLSCVFNYLPNQTDTTKERIALTYNEYSSFDDITIEPTSEIALSNQNISYESIKTPDYKKHDSVYWQQLRPTQLNVSDLEKYRVIDSLNQVPVVKLANQFAEMGISGYFDVGKWEIGPYTEILQSNEIEGTRLFLGARTSTEINENWMVYGGVAYGTKNKLFTGMGGVGYKLPGINRKIARIDYQDKYVRMGENSQILMLYENMLTPSESNLISSLFARDVFDELYRERKLQASFENEWRTGLSTTFSMATIQQFSPEYYPFLYQNQPINHIRAYEAGIKIRLSWKEQIVDKGYRRLYIGSDYPIVNFQLTAGDVSFGDINRFYAKIHGTVKGKLYLGQTYFNYALEAGKIFGTLPYTMLEIPRGNETYGYYRYDFNMINYLEFVHDAYIHTYLDYHLNGFFMNRLPLLRRWGLREVVSAKSMIGSLSNKQGQNNIALPNQVDAINGPYLELGAGLENIFRFFRVEALWRVTPSSLQNAPTFGVRALFEVKL